MLRLIVLSLAALPAFLPASAQADPRAEHAAACVAALQREAEAMAEQLRAGRTEVEPELERRLQQGFAFVGTAYKQGLREEEANRLLKAAEQAQASLSPAELARRQAACRAEGAQLFANANVVEQAFLERAAHRRLQKFKRSHAPSSSTGASGATS